MEKPVKFKRSLIIVLIFFLILAGAYIALDLEKKTLDDRSELNVKGDFIELSDGFVYYEYANSRDGPIVILIHGFSTPSYLWDPTFEFLADNGFRVLRFDLYGRGYSDRPDTEYILDLFVRQLHELITILGIENEPINLFGLSLGGPIAASYANNHPNQIQTLTLIDPYTTPASSKEIFPLNLPLIGEYITAVYLAPFKLPKVQLDDFYNPERFPDWEEKYRDQLQYKGFRKAILSTIRDTPNISGIKEYRSLEQLDLPILLIWGKEDKSIPYEDMELIKSALPDLEFHPIEDAAHLPHYEQPGIVNPILLNFLTLNNKH